jgi:hypothetical protein
LLFTFILSFIRVLVEFLSEGGVHFERFEVEFLTCHVDMGGGSYASWSNYHNPRGWDGNPPVLVVVEVLGDELFSYIVCVSTESVTPLVDVDFLGRIWIAP